MPSTEEKLTSSPPFQPYISSDTYLPEITWRAILLGAVLSIIFGATSAYLGLRVGLTVSASIPSAVIALMLFRPRTHSTILPRAQREDDSEPASAGFRLLAPAFSPV